MSGRLRIILMVLLAVCVLALVRQTRKKNVDIKYILSWLFLVIVLGILAVFPDLLTWVTALVGVTLPINLLFLLGIILILVIIYSMTIAISKMNEEIKELSQKLALTENRLREIERQTKDR